jgi:hypothetical protein
MALSLCVLSFLLWCPTLSAAPAAAPAAASAGPKPYATPRTTYAYCFAIGMPYKSSGPVHSTYYISQVFPMQAGNHPEQLFATYLRNWHPQESFSGVTCSTPSDMGIEDSSRRDLMAMKRKTFAVIEVPWTPES